MTFQKFMLVSLAIGAICVNTFAQTHATKEEAIAMANSAVAYIEKVGAEQAYKEFNDASNETWHKKDLYVVVNRNDGTSLAHGANAKMVGKNILDLKDSDGKPLIQAMLSQAKQGPGWVDYTWQNPVSKKLELKSTYVRSVSGKDAVLGVGIYK